MRTKKNIGRLTGCLAVMIWASACSTGESASPGSKTGSSDDALYGCDINQACSTPSQYCFSGVDRSSGRFDCNTADLQNIHWETKCAVGYYCDAVRFGALGCNIGADAAVQHLHCNMDPDKYVLELAKCGDGVIDPGESCDDGNNVSCDGCRADCSAVETGCGDGFVCGTEQCDFGPANVNGGACELNCTLPRCGNGIVDTLEQCDDANLTNGDTCDNNCTIPACGNGIVDPLETCDDGNKTDGDGCDSNCTATGCGNGIVTGLEQCDLGPANVNGSACEADCKLPVCGNLILDPGEQCDLGVNNANGGACELNCTLPGCGNGIKDTGEACDDGNQVNGDGCDNNCTATGCGNGILDPGEQCDDGNVVNSDTCEADCTLPFCGNGIVDIGEQCDDGNTNAGDLCSNTCTTQSCVTLVPVPCAVNTYGCVGAVLPGVSYCTDATATELVCTCLNQNDGNKGTWLPKGTVCSTTSLCWANIDGGVVVADSGTGGSGGSDSGPVVDSGTGGSGGSDSGPVVDSGTGGTTDAGIGDTGFPPNVITAEWDPRNAPVDGAVTGATVDGAVVIAGWFKSPLDTNFGWKDLCTMTLSGNVYSCPIDIPQGSDLWYGVRYVNNAADLQTLPGGLSGHFCWSLDKSTNKPCGGNGAFVGTVVLRKGVTVIPTVPQSNGQGSQTPPLFFNLTATSIL